MRQRVAEIGEPPPDNETPQGAGEKGDADTTDDGAEEKIVKHRRRIPHSRHCRCL